MSAEDEYNEDGAYIDMESMGYELCGAIEFYEDADSGTVGYKAMYFNTTSNAINEDEEELSDGQMLLKITESMLSAYVDSGVH